MSENGYGYAGKTAYGIDELLEIKKKSDEREKGVQIPVIRDFIINEIGRQKNYVECISDDRKREF